MNQHQPSVHQIERPRLRGRISGDVVPAHLAPVARLKPRRVDIRGQDMSGRADGRRERFGGYCGHRHPPPSSGHLP
jgi:hypothetical protein